MRYQFEVKDVDGVPVFTGWIERDPVLSAATMQEFYAYVCTVKDGTKFGDGEEAVFHPSASSWKKPERCVIDLITFMVLTKDDPLDDYDLTPEERKWHESEDCEILSWTFGNEDELVAEMKLIAKLTRDDSIEYQWALTDGYTMSVRNNINEY